MSLIGLSFLVESAVQIGECLSVECEFCSAVATVKSVHADEERGSGRWRVGVEFVTLRIRQARGGLISTVA